jgi:hypothetical protein
MRQKRSICNGRIAIRLRPALKRTGGYAGSFHKNNDTMQYSNNTIIIAFNIFPCLLNNILNIDPNNAQHIVLANATNANKKSNAIKTGTAV